MDSKDELEQGPEFPDLPDPAPHEKSAGDWSDDDARVYEQNFDQAEHRPVDYTGLIHDKEEPTRTNRLMSRRLVVGTNGGVLFDPVQMLPADPNRKQLFVSLDGNTAATDYVMIAESKAELMAAVSVAFRVYQNNGDHPLEDFTGPLWAWSPSANSIGINVRAVTS